MQIILDSNIEDLRSEELRIAFAEFGIPARAAKLFPQSAFPHDIAGVEDIPIDSNVVCFGGPALLQHVQQNRRWLPGGWCTFENFSCDVYYSHFGRFLANDRYSMLPASEAVRQSQYLFEQFAISGQVFARPSKGRKLFNGQLFDIDDFVATLSKLPDPRSLLVISSPKRIEREWRIYVSANRVCTYSQYSRGGTREILYDCPSTVLQFAETILSETQWRPDPIFSLDICECEGQIKLLELNGFSCSNLYAGDLNAIAKSVVSLVESDGKTG